MNAHPNITLWTLFGGDGGGRLRGQLHGDGDAANRAMSSKTSASGCLECIEACVYKQAKVADEFNVGLSKRKPIYIPFPQAVPQVVVIDPETCIEFKTGKCKKTCVEACGDRNAIDLQQQERRSRNIEVGTIILATGFQTFDARRIPYYGYGTLSERLHRARDRAPGERLRADRRGGRSCATARKPQTVGIVHCVGSRDENTNRYCSRVCCMYSLKLAHLIKEQTDAEIYQLLHRHAYARQGVRGVLQPSCRTRACTSFAARSRRSTDWASIRARTASW